MRNHKEMMQLILGVAERDENIRAVGMNGSRANPNAPKDCFQDYDIVYIVNNIGAYKAKPDATSVFGDLIVMQKPMENVLDDKVPQEESTRYNYLMQFSDGNRIDLTLCPFEEKDNWHGGDSMSVILFDKDGELPPLPTADDKSYWVKRPAEKNFQDSCNEFWWVSPYVAKGLWRKELLYAMEHMNVIRTELLKLLAWKAGVSKDFKVTTGKSYKYLEQYLDKVTWEKLCKTFPSADYAAIWDALFVMVNLFSETAKEISAYFSFEYHTSEDEKVTDYLRHIRKLSPDAKEIF